jgi:hypothetical protein
MSSLSKRQRYDYRDTDKRELKLIRVGHAIWALHIRERAKKGSTGPQEQALLAACETVWGLKKQLRAELRLERKAKFAVFEAQIQMKIAA